MQISSGPPVSEWWHIGIGIATFAVGGFSAWFAATSKAQSAETKLAQERNNGLLIERQNNIQSTLLNAQTDIRISLIREMTIVKEELLRQQMAVKDELLRQQIGIKDDLTKEQSFLHMTMQSHVVQDDERFLAADKASTRLETTVGTLAVAVNAISVNVADLARAVKNGTR